jgi:uncharacterized protein YecE (DUF72 family)
MPTQRGLAAWGTQVPAAFRFSLKAPQIITHFKRLKDAERETERFLEVAGELGARLGPLLFQLPPNMKLDLPRLDAFLESLGKRTRTAFEFRHDSWIVDDVFDRLRAHSCALCVADSEDLPLADLINTAGWGYIRLRREEYSDESLLEWLAKFRSQGWSEAYILFKHEDSASGPRLAKRFLEIAAS